jgi:hypothetical protein
MKSGRLGGVLFAGAALLALVFQISPAEAAGKKIEHVILISLAGMHEVDLERYVAANPGSTLSKLIARGTSYTQVQASRPSDSFPGMVALVTGGLPKTTGIIYDESFDRSLSPAGSGARSGRKAHQELHPPPHHETAIGHEPTFRL